MSFSELHRVMLKNQKHVFASRFFQRVQLTWSKSTLSQQQAWMIAFLDALCQHSPDEDLSYLVSTRSLSHFVGSLRVLLDYCDVDLLCFELCDAHVRHECICRTRTLKCLAPH